MNLWNSLSFLYTQIYVFTFQLNFSASYSTTLPIPVAAGSKAWDCGRWLFGIAGSNHAERIDICLLWVLCVVRQRSLRRADHSSKGVLPSDMCLQCDFETSTMKRPSPTKVVEPWKKITLHDVSAGCLANSVAVTAILTRSVDNKKLSV